MPQPCLLRKFQWHCPSGYSQLGRESWEVSSGRILDGFSSIARKIERQGGGQCFVVNHGMILTDLGRLLAPEAQKRLALDNGSITVIKYEDG